MRVLVDDRHGDPEAALGTSQASRGASARSAGEKADPTVPDTSYLQDAMAAAKAGNPDPLRQVLRSFFDTFAKVVMQNPTNRIEPAGLLRLQELAAKAKRGELAPDDPELLALGAAAQRHGRAVGAIYGFFLRLAPYEMFAEIRHAGLKAFQPMLGPVLVVEGNAVRDVLSRHDEFTVDPYGLEMVKTMTSSFNGPNGGPGLSTFVLSTDQAETYEADKRLLLEVVSSADIDDVQPLVHEDCLRRVGAAVRDARASGRMELDVVQAAARYVPVTVGKLYLGVPTLDRMAPFELSDDMLRYYGQDLLGGPDGKQPLRGTGLAREDGVVADEATMYEWIKAAFESFFNNVQKDVEVQRAGFRSCRLLLCSLLREIGTQKERMRKGARLAKLGQEPGPDELRSTMLTRLVQKQLDGSTPAHQVTDLRIAENVMGTVVGAVAGQEEATCRVIDALLKLKENSYETASPPHLGGSFDDAREQALIALDETPDRRSAKMTARTRLFHYFRECLRLEPQGEVLLRRCRADATRLFSEPQAPHDAARAAFAGNRPLRAGDLVFAGHGAAMQDVEAPREFRLQREPSADTHLFYGYGRHKCLGQHISPVIVMETMIALLALDDLRRASAFELDDKKLYARRLLVSFTDGASTRKVYPASATDAAAGGSRSV
jgi:cytochrome P450